MNRPPMRTRNRVAKEPKGPWTLPPIGKLHGGDDADVYAIQALAKGTANPAQQQRALNFIIHAICDTDAMSIYPDLDDRATYFAEGKHHVGRTLRRIAGLRPRYFGVAADREPEPPAPAPEPAEPSSSTSKQGE